MNAFTSFERPHCRAPWVSEHPERARVRRLAYDEAVAALSAVKALADQMRPHLDALEEMGCAVAGYDASDFTMLSDVKPHEDAEAFADDEVERM